MNKRITARIVAGTLASAILALAALASPAQAKDTGWPMVQDKGGVTTYRIIG